MPIRERDRVHSLRKEWTWLRENPSRWRIRDGALEIRVEPGDAHSVRNALLLPAPDRSKGPYRIEVTVRNLTVPTEQYEQAGMTWYSNGQPVFKLVKERVDGELMIIPSRKSMTQIAAECGFADQSHMTNIFRRRVGMTPTAFRDA